MPTNVNDLSTLRQNLVESPAARAAFLSDLLGLLKTHGVDVDNPDVLNTLDLDLNLSDGQAFVDGLRASTVIVTIVM